MNSDFSLSDWMKNLGTLISLPTNHGGWRESERPVDFQDSRSRILK